MAAAASTIWGNASWGRTPDSDSSMAKFSVFDIGDPWTLTGGCRRPNRTTVTPDSMSSHSMGKAIKNRGRFDKVQYRRKPTFLGIVLFGIY